MAKSKLMELRIRPAANGGHTVSHEFEPRPAHSRGPRTGGIFMDRPPTEEHTFGPKEHGQLIKHVAQALALKDALGGGAPQAMGAAAGATPAGEEEPEED